ncbi:MAG: hypothetical protein D6831_03205 [Aquificota bacterium]|nr:MAG: hypothetical protein D6831_03205 [Aquificota bacterium]
MAIKALEDALTIIELIRQRYEAGISEISKELNMNKNKVFRLITTLELKGLVEINEENRKYRLGINFIKLEHSFVKSLNFLETSKPFLRTLKQDVEENVYVSIPQKKDVVYIYEETINKQVIVY